MLFPGQGELSMNCRFWPHQSESVLLRLLSCLWLLVVFCSCSNSFTVGGLAHSTWSIGVSRTTRLARPLCQSSDDMTENDEENTIPYRNRSLAWTNRYRTLIPYEKARQEAISMGFYSKEEWDEYVADGKKYHGPYLPSHPDKMYPDDFESWEDFLGLMRSYEDAKQMVQTVLRIQTLEE